jgi:membrane-bound metal-dependent hydrolase YbcI (DUF457 family)
MAAVETHISSAPLMYLCVSIFQGWMVTPLALVMSVIGSVLPDVDGERSVIGRLCPVVPICRRLGMRVEHRGFFHSLTLLVISSFALLPFLWNSTEAVFAFALSMLQHQILDSMSSGRGIRWMAPFSRNDWLLTQNTSLDIPFGSAKEKRIRWVLIGATAFLLWVNYETPKLILNNRVFVDVTAAIETFHDFGDSHNLEASFTGKLLETNQPVSGEAKILGKEGRYLVVLYGNRMVSLTDGLSSADIRADKVKVSFKERIRAVAHSFELRKVPVCGVGCFVDASKSYRLFGEILLDQTSGKRVYPRFAPVKVNGRRLTLRFATLGDLRPYEDLFMEHASLTVRYELRENEDVPPFRDELTRTPVVFEVESIADVLVSMGETISSEKTLARRAKEFRNLQIARQEAEMLREQMRSKKQEGETQCGLLALEKDLARKRMRKVIQRAEAYRILVRERVTTKAEVNQVDEEAEVARNEYKKAKFELKRFENSLRQGMAALGIAAQKAENKVKELGRKAFVFSDVEGIVADIKTQGFDKKYRITIFVIERSNGADKTEQ